MNDTQHEERFNILGFISLLFHCICSPNVHYVTPHFCSFECLFIEYSQYNFFLSHWVTPKTKRSVKDSKVRHVVTARIQLLVSTTDHFPGTEHLWVHTSTLQSALSLPHTHTRTCWPILSLWKPCHKTSKEGRRLCVCVYFFFLQVSSTWHKFSLLVWY